MWWEFGTLWIFCIAGIALGMEPSRDQLVKTAYCMCRCCSKDQNDCILHASVDQSFKCSESMCSKQMCEVWAKGKCKNYCFCKKCKSIIEKNDKRCVSKIRPEGCECKKVKIDCEKTNKQPEKIKEMFDNEDPEKKKKSECAIPCYCKNCKSILPPKNTKICDETPAPPSHCNCENVKCPGPEVIKNMDKFQEVKDTRGGAEYDTAAFAEEMDMILTPEQSKAMKCRMQCQCSVCGDVANNDMEKTCKKMLPKHPIKDCPVCDPDKVDCRRQTVDQECKILCFCKDCKDDPRMPFNAKQGCMDAVKKGSEGCPCGEKIDCSVIEKIQERGSDTFQSQMAESREKRSKKGKLKKKKADKDEL